MANDLIADLFNFLREIVTNSEGVGQPSLTDVQIQAIMDGKTVNWANTVLDANLLPVDAELRQGGREFSNIGDLYAYLRKGGLVGGSLDNPQPLSFVWIHQYTSDVGTVWYDVYFTEDS